MSILQLHVKETLDAIYMLTEDDPDSLISVKKIRIYYGVKSTEKVKISYFWRSLKFLEDAGILELVKKSTKNAKQYRLITNIDGFYSQMLSDVKA